MKIEAQNCSQNMRICFYSLKLRFSYLLYVCSHCCTIVIFVYLLILPYSQRTMYDIKIDYLSRKLAEAAAPFDDLKNKVHSLDHDEVNTYGDKTAGLQELESMEVIKQLQEEVCFIS